MSYVVTVRAPLTEDEAREEAQAFCDQMKEHFGTEQNFRADVEDHDLNMFTIRITTGFAESELIDYIGSCLTDNVIDPVVGWEGSGSQTFRY